MDKLLYNVSMENQEKDIVPFRDPKCPICKLDLEAIQDIHSKKWDQKWNYKKVLEYVRNLYQISPSYSKLCDHFRKHTAQHHQEKMINKGGKGDSKIKHAIDTIPKESRSLTAKDLETAYSQLVKIANTFTSKVTKIGDILSIDEDDLKQQIKKMGTLEALEKFSKLLKESREQVKDITALRAPKVMVSQYLEQGINEIINSTGYILNDVCRMIQASLVKKMSDEGVDTDVFAELFTEVFKQAAIQYRDRMIALKREQMSKANMALAELEKII